MRRSLLTFAVAGVVFLAGAPVVAQITGVSPDVYPHPTTAPAYRIAAAYPGFSNTYTTGIAPNKCWRGFNQPDENIKAVPGVFCLTRGTGTFRLDYDAFATPDSSRGEYNCRVQSYRLRKDIPGSQKCPWPYGDEPHSYYQFGSGVRTWWTLIYTQPGTRFILDVTVVCRTLTNQQRIHIDRWTWEVVADINTFENLIHVLHQNTIGILEIPCIAGEDMYDALLAGVRELRLAPTRWDQQDALFNLEALILTYTAFGEYCEPEYWFPDGPPGNLSVNTPMDVAGIIDTTENPCACKLIVDLEYIGVQLGIVSPL